MRCGLLDALTGRFPDGDRVADVPEAQHRLRSILGNLGRLFNTRSGSLAHVPAYGLPDLTDLARGSSEDIESARRAIREAVERFEPRLRRVRVERDVSVPADATGTAGAGDGPASCLVFVLSAEIVSEGRVELEAMVRSGEPVEVRRKHAS